MSFSACFCVFLALAGVWPYREALPGYRYRFPRDHFEHPEFRTEWWYYTGNVHASDGKRFGFEMVFFRQAQRRGPAENPSVWRIDDLYLAHLALTDIDRRQFRYARRLNRAGPGIAGASFEQQRVWNGNWSAQWKGDEQTLEATVGEFRFHLRLQPLKPTVIHGVNGVSRKSEGAGRASHYVSFPRMSVEGELRVGSRSYQVRGLAWMDHEWFTNQLDSSQAGWDWFSVQLDNGTELMLFELRRRDGSLDPHSSGTFIDRAGKARHLSHEEFTLRPEAYWTSAKTRARYPVRWGITVPSAGVSLVCRAALENQELAEASGPVYWEGAVTYEGTSSGVGYLEMTGYDKPVKLE